MKKTEISVSVVTVTYGNRTDYLTQVVDEVLRQGVNEVIIVDNNPNRNLNRLFTDKRVIILPQTSNIGPAAGYGVGIQYFFDNSDSKYVWLLDDDNLPDPNALATLTSYAAGIMNPLFGNIIAIAQERLDRPTYRKAIQSRDALNIFGRKNSFLGVHLFRKWEKLLQEDKTKLDTSIDEGPIYAAPYGGLFTSRETIKRIGIPDSNYYMYVDDLEYTNRIRRIGGLIIYTLLTHITDLVPSWHIELKGSKPEQLLRHSDSAIRAYYQIRNRTHFDKTFLMDKPLLFYTNVVAFTVSMFLLNLFIGRWDNFFLYCKAVYHGLRGKLGKHKDYYYN